MLIADLFPSLVAASMRSFDLSENRARKLRRCVSYGSVQMLWTPGVERDTTRFYCGILTVEA
jgi:hypothetical protein